MSDFNPTRSTEALDSLLPSKVVSKRVESGVTDLTALEGDKKL
jgi:hypothetical protein